MAKSSSSTLTGRVSPSENPQWRDYLELTKPKVVAMLLLTAMVGMCLAVPSLPPAKAVILGLLGIRHAISGCGCV